MSDLSILLEWENDPKNWDVSETVSPFSEQEMIDFIVEQSHFLASGQVRLMICLKKKNVAIGAIDLFDVNIEDRSAGIGILIQEEKYRNKGYAKEALQLLVSISKDALKLKTLNCTIHANNLSSIHLFQNCGFKKLGGNKAIQSYFIQP